MAKSKTTRALASHGRALVKAVTWRTVGTLDTFLWSYVVTGHPVAAGAIASMETFTKVVLYYLHERLWRLFKWSPASQLRSLTKAISWRFVGSLDTFLLSLIVTGNARYAVSIASIEAVTKIVLYYIHERVWRSVAWGRLEEDARSRTAAPDPVPPGAEPAAETARLNP
ncbi:MAG: DUF2061 domain-containing protein [Alphaproteobacteria bacterium]|nr:DUF2061 domain-containing protein [Alphaproteobacteria bacterium]